MFEYSFVPTGKPHPLPFAAACVTEAMLLAGIAVIPLLFVQSLPDRALYSAFRLASVPTAPPSPPPPMLVAKVTHRTAPVPRVFRPDVLVSPIVVPKEVAIIDDGPPSEIGAVMGGVPGGIPGGIGLGTEFGSGLGVVLPPPPPPPSLAKVVTPATPPPPVAVRQVIVGGDVQAAMILKRIEPQYPLLAHQGHISGNVVLSAVIGVDGKIKNLSAVSGHPLLVESAMNAVRQWVYKPTLLNGVPAEVVTEIVVHFRFAS